MDPKDERLEPVMNFTIKSLRLEPEQWQHSVSDEDNQLTLNGFVTGQDHCFLFICLGPERVPEHAAEPLPMLRFSLIFPRDVSSKVVCVNKPGCEALTKESSKKLVFTELPGDEVLSVVTAHTDKMGLLLLGNHENSSNWPEGLSEEVLHHMERQKNQALVVKAQTQGRTFLPQPGLHDDAPDLGQWPALYQDQDQTEDCTQDSAPRGSCHLDLLQDCDWTIIEWAELVTGFLKQDSSELLLDRTRPLPREEFRFWENRLQNLLFIHLQLSSSRAQRVASIVENAHSVYASTLRDIRCRVQQGLKEAEDVNQNLRPLQNLLDQLQQLDYSQLKNCVDVLMEEVRLVWTRSRFYCRLDRIRVLLQEICNLFIHLSRSFLGRGQVMRGLVLDPGPVLEAVCLCMETLQRLKESFRESRAQLEALGSGTPRWDFPSQLIFVQLDLFLQQLENIRGVYRITLDLSYLDQAILSGINGRKWTGLIQEVYNHFLCNVTTLSESKCDATDPDDQVFSGLWVWFQSQVEDVENRLVTIFSSALETCSSSSSAVKLVKMFQPVLTRPLILDQLRPQFNSVWNMIQSEVDQTELMAQNQIRIYSQSRVQTQVYSGFRPSAASALIWSQQLDLRAQDSLRNLLLIRTVDSSGAQQVFERYQNLVDLLQDFRDSVRTEWSECLEKDFGWILEQPVIHLQQNTILGVPCGPKLEALLRQLQFLIKQKEVKLRPQASHLFTCRNDITQTYLSLCTLQTCYNQVVTSVDPVELPLIQDQLQDLTHSLSGLQTRPWRSEGLLEEIQKQKNKVLSFHQTVTEARAKTAAINQIIQDWSRIQLLQRKEDGLLRGGAIETSQSHLFQDSQELLRLTQENKELYSVQDSSEAWVSYLDHIHDLVQSGLAQLLQSALSILSLKTPGAPLLSVTLVLEPGGTLFVHSHPCDSSAVVGPSGGCSVDQCLSLIVSQLYNVTDLVPRLSPHRHHSHQWCLRQSPALVALEQKVRSRAQEVSEEVECLRSELDLRYAHLWLGDRQEVLREFLRYGRQLDPEEQEVDEAPPTLSDFKREIQRLQSIRSSLSSIDDLTVLQGWLQVNLRPFRDSVMSLTDKWSHMFTEPLLQTAANSLLHVTQSEEDETEATFLLTQTLFLLESSGVPADSVLTSSEQTSAQT